MKSVSLSSSGSLPILENDVTPIGNTFIGMTFLDIPMIVEIRTVLSSGSC
jgi:hypothetical protein